MKALKAIWNFITTVLVIIVVILAIALVGVRLIGLTPYTVLSGSMEPAYHVGSLIYDKVIDPADITPGTVITFVLNEDGLYATHRVVEVDVQETVEKYIVDEDGENVLDEDGQPQVVRVLRDETCYYFTTKGDANASVDGGQVYYKNVIGTPVFSIPYLGYLSSFLQTKRGMTVGICAGAAILLITFIPDVLRSMDDSPSDKSKKSKKKKKKKKSSAA